MLKQKRFCGYRAYTARAEQLREGYDEVDDKDEEFAHPMNTTIIAGPRKTAQRGRIASHYEFAPHRFCAATALVPAYGRFEMD